MLRRIPLAGFLACLTLPAAAQAPHAPPTQNPWAILSRPSTRTPTPTSGAITSEDLKSRLYRFAADSMQGRFMGTEGNFKGVEYIASELRRLGLEPAGENGTFFQTLPWMERGLDSTGTLAAGSSTFHVWTDYVPRDQGLGQRSLDGVPVVYGGDFADSVGRLSAADAADKVVVLTYSGTVPGNSPGIPNRMFVNRGYPQAVGILIVGLEALTPADLTGFRQLSRYLERDGTPPAVPTYLYASRPFAEAVFGRSLSGLAVGTRGTPLRGTPAYTTRPSPVPARNVVAILRGRDPALRNTYVAIGAHNDHIGMGQPVAFDSQYVINHLYRPHGAESDIPDLTPEQAAEVNRILADVRRATSGASARPDSIFNGADDDASGTVAVLEIARVLAAGPRPKRTIVFAATTGEEVGLLGTRWYIQHPAHPLDKTVANLEIEMIGRPDSLAGGRGKGWLTGYERSTMGEALAAAGIPLVADKRPEQNFFMRSDNIAFARLGIPAHTLSSFNLHTDYHKRSDDVSHADAGHMAQVIDAAARAVRLLADGPKPTWKPGGQPGPAQPRRP